MNQKSLIKKASRLALFFESYILPVLYLISICQLISYIWERRSSLGQVWEHVLRDPNDINHILFLSLIVAKFFFIILYFLTALGLIVRRNLKVEPEDWLEIIVPLVGTFFYLFYQLIPYLPDRYNAYILPAQIFYPAILIGTLLNIIGFIIAGTALYNLMYSMSIFIQVRDLVTGGLYTFVRHPIYLGYIISHVGIGLIQPRPGYIILSLFLIAITVYRARLEEKKLLYHCPEYKEYARKTPFLFPNRLFNR